MAAVRATIWELDGKWWLSQGDSGDFKVHFAPDKPKTVAMMAKAADSAGRVAPAFFASYNVPQSVVQFSQAMAGSQAGHLDPISDLLAAADQEIFIPNEEITIDQLFEDVLNILHANELEFGDAVVWQGESLLDFIEDFIEEAGEALVEALAVVPLAMMVKTALPSLRGLTTQKNKAIKSQKLAAFHQLFFVDSPDFTISYHNVSGKDWIRWEQEYVADAGQRAISTAGETLTGGAGNETLSMSSTADNVSVGPNQNISLGFKSPDQGNDFVWFAVRIVVPFQFLHMGDSPYYEVRHTGQDDWKKPSGNPADSYDKVIAGYEIKVTPTAGGITFSASVGIKKHKA